MRTSETKAAVLFGLFACAGSPSTPPRPSLRKTPHPTATYYRQQMKSLAKLRAVPVPFTILTAIEPPVLRDTLLDNFQASQALLHIMPTNRPDISYSVSRDAVRDMPQAVLTHRASLWPKLSNKGQDIVL
ncbi:hypothetical protein EHS25_004809 [Saitozyma podzolica]|uniref:Uncharacterized protein n=1 Tax=Saitozyma podzolica TaxID=1890683 RepID=A0A427Y304_9TREE|nr:hypothetical protein EHS25_004809 [Saitozyma podzolica]